MNRILVTGGTGFIGSHLCEQLLKDSNNYVICLDNNFTGCMENIAEIMNNPRFEFIRHDIVLPIYLEVDQIYHLACPASPKAYQKNPIKTIKTGILGMFNVLGMAKRVGARLVYTSTSEVYGDPEVSPQREDYWGNVNPVGKRSCYDEAKRCGESLCMEYKWNNGVDVRIARIFNTYGPRLAINDGRVVSNFISQALNDEPITLYGDGSQTRSFCYVSDTVNGLIRLMECEKVESPVNIGNPMEITVRELAERVVELCDSCSPLVERELPKDDPKKRKPDIGLARELFGWKPKVELRNGLQETIRYFVKKMKEDCNIIKV